MYNVEFAVYILDITSLLSTFKTSEKCYYKVFCRYRHIEVLMSHTSYQSCFKPNRDDPKHFKGGIFKGTTHSLLRS